MNLVQEYLMLAIEVASFDGYDNIMSVNAYNRQVARMRNIAIEIENGHPDLKYAFCGLLSHKDKRIRLWTAHHILEVMHFDESSRKAALKVIRAKARTDKTASSFGEKIWLKEWYKSHPKDRWISCTP